MVVAGRPNRCRLTLTKMRLFARRIIPSTCDGPLAATLSVPFWRLSVSFEDCQIIITVRKLILVGLENEPDQFQILFGAFVEVLRQDFHRIRQFRDLFAAAP